MKPTMASSNPAPKITSSWSRRCLPPTSGKEAAPPQDAGQQGGQPDQGADHQEKPDVMVLDVAHLMAGYALQLFAVHNGE